MKEVLVWAIRCCWLQHEHAQPIFASSIRHVGPPSIKCHGYGRVGLRPRATAMLQPIAQIVKIQWHVEMRHRMLSKKLVIIYRIALCSTARLGESALKIIIPEASINSLSRLAVILCLSGCCVSLWCKLATLTT